MTKLTDTQRRILKAASQEPKADVRGHMQNLKSPAIRDKVLESMIKHGLVEEDPDADGVVYVVSEAGYAAIGKTKPESPEGDAGEERQETAAPEPEAETSAAKPAPKRKREGSKKQVMIDLLSREGGVTIAEMMTTIGWQKHSVHGAMANLKKELQEKHGQTINAVKSDGTETVYKIA